MCLFGRVRRSLAALAGFWWRGMRMHARVQLRQETEALERYRDQARGWHTVSPPAAETKRYPPV